MSKIINIDEYMNTKKIDEIAKMACEAYNQCIMHDDELKEDVSKTVRSIRAATPDHEGLCSFDSCGFVSAFTRGFVEGLQAFSEKYLQEMTEKRRPEA